MPKPLIIVESPAKARTIAGFLGGEYEVASSVGHIRDLPSTAAEIPKRFKEEPWARLGVNVESDFEPIYVNTRGKSSVIRELKAKLKDAPELYLATDEDREGESIAWHLREVLKPKVPVKRMVFHEITKSAIEEALANPRDIDEQLVDAQETRRILDRLYGYEVSPVLWKKVKPRLSAGRVQSVAVRIIVERERERLAFVKASYWDLTATVAEGDCEDLSFEGGLRSVDGVRVASGSDFSNDGTLKKDVLVLDEAEASGLAATLADAPFRVTSVETKPYTRKPYAPFRTSTLQQEAGRKLGFTASRTMRAAQRLYENGFITYMRTDSTNLSGTAINAARSAATKRFGPEFVPEQPRFYGKQAKGAQEAHEAIRPAGDEFRDPGIVARQVDSDEGRLYDLIWKRTLACQMADAKGETLRIVMHADASDGRTAEFTSSGRTITFPGFLAAYVRADQGTGKDDDERHLPRVEEGVVLTACAIEPVGHETKPPSRYTEASLVAELEELGVGRPSTYASIISTIQNRGYVWKKGSALVPSFTAFATTDLLERHFGDLVDYQFTADMESDLDRIAEGSEERSAWLRAFYFGEDDDPGLKPQIEGRLDEIDPRVVNAIPIRGSDIVARVGRYGPYLERDGVRASLPDDLPPDELTAEKCEELLTVAAAGPRELGEDPESGLTVYVHNGRYGPYVQLGEQEPGSKKKPKRASLQEGMTEDSVTLHQALELLEWPKLLGTHPDTGKDVVVSPGRYGPYVNTEEEYRTLADPDRLHDTTLERAVLMLSLPKGFVLLGNTKADGKEPLGLDDEGGGVWLLRQRKKYFVWDEEVMAALADTDDPEDISLMRALELLEQRRAALAEKEAD